MINKDFCTETKIVGVTKLNDHNIPIQSLLPSLKEGDRIVLIRDYANRYDDNAIQVYARIEQRLEHIGYISASLAEQITSFLDKNPKYDIEGVVRGVTGGTDGKCYGCNITIWIQDPDEPSYEEIHAFARSMSNSASSSQNTSEVKANTENSNSNVFIFFLIFLTAFLAIVLIVLSIMFINTRNSTEVPSQIQSSQSVETNASSDEQISLNTSSSFESSKESYWSEAPASSYDVSSSTSSTNNSEVSSSVSSSTDTSSSIFSASENEVLVKITDISLTTKILPPNTIGTIWIEATYTNNSNYAITSVSYKYLCKDTNTTHYLSTYDTVLSGETSPMFDGFGPDSGREEDVEFLSCDIAVIDKTGDKVYIEYDYKLNSYKMY